MLLRRRPLGWEARRSRRGRCYRTHERLAEMKSCSREWRGRVKSDTGRAQSWCPYTQEVRALDGRLDIVRTMMFVPVP